MTEEKKTAPKGLPVKNDDGTPFYLEFTPVQLLELAVWMERTGAEFYRFLAERSTTLEVREFFLGLMGTELMHEKHLRRLYQEAANAEVEYLGIEDGKVTGAEYLRRLKEAAKKKIFLGQIQAPDPDQPISLEQGLEMALTVEHKSVQLYSYIGRFRLYGDAIEVIAHLRRDEEGHVDHIGNMMRKLAGQGA